MILYYVGHKNSVANNSWLAVTNNEAEANSILKTIKGATCVVAKTYASNWRLKENESD
jgi:hypothetical protein